MSLKSSIEWTDATWNPIRGCTKVSPGCAHCYACTLAERFRGVPGHPFEQGFDLKLIPENMSAPLDCTTPRKIFVNSMSDLFHPLVPDHYIRQVAEVMLKGQWHTFQVLTKRSERLKNALNTFLRDAAEASHIWWGVSVEDRKYGVPRIKDLRASPARIKFLSVEPLLEDIGQLELEGIHWMIVGGESGPRARQMKQTWVTPLREQCEQANVAFFFKQWGGVRKHKHGRELDGRTHDAFPILQ